MTAESVHVSVMPREVLHYLQLDRGLTVMDGTVGAAGHSVQICERIGSTGCLLGFDRDPMMLQFAQAKLSAANARLFHSSYADAEAVLSQAGVDSVDRVLLDLGLSSDQLADRDRGFGFDAGGPLDMRFDVSQGKSAAEILSTSSQQELTTILEDYGEEPFARQIAEAVASRQKSAKPATAHELEVLIRDVVPHRATKGRKNPATRTFQALRIAANQELEHVQKMMTSVLPRILKPGGIVVVLTFHSLEDRIVKNAFKGQQLWKALTRSPIEATPAEIRLNPRSRSAKLRAAQRKMP